ncbi:MAG: S1-C subfamily serine protease [Nitrospinales bacterium]|jgi:S1-C subfamily serine protease
MIKGIGGFFLLAVLLIILILNTHSTLLGSGFLIGDGAHVFTFHDLVKEAETLRVKFPNEDDIEAELVYFDSASNLAILKLKEKPKVKRQPLFISQNGLGAISESVFTLGYPWTNTLQDQHILIEGSTGKSSMLVELKMSLDPVHSGSPLFNARQEVAGMVLSNSHAQAAFSVKGSHQYAIPSSQLEKALKAAKIDISTHPVEGFATRDEFIVKSRNNIVLIEAR